MLVRPDRLIEAVKFVWEVDFGAWTLPTGERGTLREALPGLCGHPADSQR